ncbi:hypothetical protein RRG08_007163, partial [Elysia crispata]
MDIISLKVFVSTLAACLIIDGVYVSAAPDIQLVSGLARGEKLTE